MALIECPECGQKVSSNAATCIHCGSPLQKEKNMLSIRMARISMTRGGLGEFISDSSFDIIDDESGAKLANVKEGQVWNIELDVPKKLRFHFCRGLKGIGPKDLIFDYVPNGVARYEMELIKGFWRHSFALNKVDMIVGSKDRINFA